MNGFTELVGMAEGGAFVVEITEDGQRRLQALAVEHGIDVELLSDEDFLAALGLEIARD